jgi:predicted methyltransferase
MGAHLAAAQPVSPVIAAAVADTNRPADDAARDARRKPGQAIAFSGMKPGDKVIDFLPGEGYYTRIFAKVVGPKGHVYAELPSEFVAAHPRGKVTMTALTAMPAYANTSLEVKSYADFGAPQKVNIVWTSLNYHDLHNPSFAVQDINVFNKAVYDALKPGGVYLIIDHAAAPGAGFTATQTLHRSEAAAVTAEVEKAGFKLDGQGDFLANPADDHTTKSGTGPRDSTDQYVLRFRKPR